MNFIPAEIIKRKKLGEANTKDEIEFMIENYAKETGVEDYHMSAWGMAIYFNGMNTNEIAHLTLAMKNSGKKFDLDFLNQPRVDKHSTGGVGDKTSIIIGPIMAACNVKVPMIAGRGLGHTGGTLDKLESIENFNINLSIEELTKIVEEHHFALMGQTNDICPADKKFYALRDVTGIVDSLPLICGSIMSKKLSEDLTGLVLDVKYGSGAFMKSEEDAEKLGALLKETGELNGVKVTALITDMNEPLGKYIGNSLEIKECIEILQGKSATERTYDYYYRTKELSLILCGHMLHLAGKSNSPQEGYTLAESKITDGSAYKAFLKWCKYQGNANPDTLPIAKQTSSFVANKTGYVTFIDTEKIGIASLELGAGRKKSTDSIDYAAGIESSCYLGKKVSEGDTLYTLHYNCNEEAVKKAKQILEKAIIITEENSSPKHPFIAKILH